MSASVLFFNSFLKSTLASYLEFRQSLGYAKNTALFYTLRDFDYYLVFHDIAKASQMDEALLVHWLHSKGSQTSRTKNRKLAIIRGLFRYLIRTGQIQNNPAGNIPYLKEKPYKPYIYTLEELGRILRQANQWQYRRADRFSAMVMETLIYLIYACGLRLGESLRLKIKDVDFNEKTLSLWKTKFHKERIIPFSEEAGVRLQKYLQARNQRYGPPKPEDYIFRHKRGHYGGGTIETKFKKLLVACGFPNAKASNAPRLHDLRHTMATHRLYQWYQEGHDVLNKLPLLSTYLGHVNIESTQVYLTIIKALLREGNKRFRDRSEAIPRDFINAALKKKHAGY